MVTCGPTAGELLINGKFFDAVVCPFSETMGLAVFALMVYGAIGVALYVYSGNAVLPLTLTVILGSVVITQLPGPAVQLVALLALLLIAAGGYWLTISRGPSRI